LICKQINDLICAKLFNFVLNTNDALRVIIKLIIIYNSCDVSNFTTSCIIFTKRDFAKVYNKNFSKTFQKKIKITQNNYSLYCRCNDKRTFIRRKCDRDITFDNCCIISYNSYFIRKYKTHINVKLCNSINVVKYIYKYIYKEDNRITLRM